MSGHKIIEGLKEALAVTRGEIKPVRLREYIFTTHLFTCLRCEQHYETDEAVSECPVCGWRKKGAQTSGMSPSNDDGTKTPPVA